MSNNNNSYNIIKNKISTANRLIGFDSPTVWQEFTPLANKHQSVNLGQGFPNWDTPEFIKKALCNAINSNHNQYTRSAGDLSLVNALSKHYSPLIGRTINPLTEITISVGATEGMYAIFQSLINPDDEVVVLEPAFDTYPAHVQMAGGICKFVPLTLTNDSNGKSVWLLDLKKLEESITPKTKIILLNTPHNPSGKVLSKQELIDISNILLRNPHVIAVMDEVYEKLVYDDKEHIRLASLPGMWERTITVSSSGKTFSATGWKVGWCYGPEELIQPIVLANQWIQYCVSSPTQSALAEIIEEADKPYLRYSSYYQYINKEYQRKRDFLAQTLINASLRPAIPEGGFFIIADTSAHEIPDSHYLPPGPTGETPVTRDWAFARWLTIDVGVTPIPPSAFYIPTTKQLARNMARFAFCKTDDALILADERLRKLNK
eukprot:gene22031-28516_t